MRLVCRPVIITPYPHCGTIRPHIPFNAIIGLSLPRPLSSILVLIQALLEILGDIFPQQLLLLMILLKMSFKNPQCLALRHVSALFEVLLESLHVFLMFFEHFV